MHCSRHAEAWLIGALAALASFCALQAGAAETHSIVAQSDASTAATGRRPLSKRIAAAALPIQVESRSLSPTGAAPSPEPPIAAVEPLAAATPDLPVAERLLTTAAVAQIVEPPVAESGGETDGAFAEASEPLEGSSIDAAPAEEDFEDDQRVGGPAETALLAEARPRDSSRVDDPALAAPPDESLPAEEAAPPTGGLRGLLLRRVKVALAGIPRPIDPHAVRGRAIPPRELPPPKTTAEHGAPVNVGTHAPGAPVRTVTPGAIAAPAAAGTPARLEFDVCESRSIVGEGEQLVMRIDVRNVGGAPAEGVTATLFFAEGVEPVQSIGHAAEVYPGEVRFAAVEAIPPGDAVHLLVTAVGTKQGSVTYRGELECRQLPGRLAREGAVTVSPRQASVPDTGGRLQ